MYVRPITQSCEGYQEQVYSTHLSYKWQNISVLLSDLYSMQNITLRISQLCESHVFDLRRQLEQISSGHQNIPVYMLFAALDESGVMVEDFLTMQVSDNASCVAPIAVTIVDRTCVFVALQEMISFIGTSLQWRALHPSFKLPHPVPLPRSVVVNEFVPCEICGYKNIFTRTHCVNCKQPIEGMCLPSVHEGE